MLGERQSKLLRTESELPNPMASGSAQCVAASARGLPCETSALRLRVGFSEAGKQGQETYIWRPATLRGKKTWLLGSLYVFVGWPQNHLLEFTEPGNLQKSDAQVQACFQREILPFQGLP